MSEDGTILIFKFNFDNLARFVGALAVVVAVQVMPLFAIRQPNVFALKQRLIECVHGFGANATNAISKSMCATRDRFQWSLHCWLWTSWELCVRRCWIRWATRNQQHGTANDAKTRNGEQGKIKRNETKQSRFSSRFIVVTFCWFYVHREENLFSFLPFIPGLSAVSDGTVIVAAAWRNDTQPKINNRKEISGCRCCCSQFECERNSSQSVFFLHRCCSSEDSTSAL